MEEKELLLKEIQGMVKGYVSKEDLDKALESAIAKAQENFAGVELEKSITELKEIALKQGEAIAKMKVQEQAQVQTIKMQLEAQKESLKAIANGDFSRKAVILPTSITSNFNGQVDPRIGQIATRDVLITQLFAQSAIAPDYQGIIRYMDETTSTSGAAARTKGDAAGEGTIAWTGYTLETQSISHIIPMAKEMLENYNFIETAVNQWLLKQHALKVENDVLLGSGVAPIIKGLNASATAWTNASSFTTEAPGILDLIQVVATQVATASPYRANYVLMNDFDALELKLEKTDLGMYKFPNFMSADGMAIDNIRIIPTSLVTKDTMFVGDFNYGTFFAKPTTIEIGTNADDFSKRKVSMLANIECGLLIRNVDAQAFQKVASIAAGITAITKGA